MTFWEILNNMSDFLFVFFWTFFVLCIGAILIYSAITKRPIEEIINAGAMANIEEDEYIKRLDKLQDTLDCLASKHLDAETMRELQGASEEAKEPEEPYIPPLDETFDDESFEEWVGMLNSTTDGLINIYSEQMKRAYSKMPADDDTRHERRRAKLEEEIYYCRFFIAFYSFVQTQGIDAFELYLRRECFVPVNDEVVERKNKLENETEETKRKAYEPPELVELVELSEFKNDDT